MKHKTLLLVLISSILIILIGFISFGGLKYAYQALDYRDELGIDTTKQEEKEEVEVKTYDAQIMCAGDFVMHKPIIESSYYQKDQSFDFSDIFYYIRDVYRDSDFCVATLEGALCESDYSGYPLFRTPSTLIDNLADQGIDLINMANNHVYDDYHNGVLHSIEVLEDKHMDYQGIQKNESAKNYYIKEIQGIKVGCFNYVYETMDAYGTPGINGISLDPASIPLINSFSPYDLDGLYSEVQEILTAMKQEGVEYTIAYMHWGDEYQHYPNAYQQAIAQQFCEMGIDALIGSHPHVVQTTDLLVSKNGHEMLCAYSLGNHLSNQRVEYMDGISNGNTEDGLMVKLDLHKDEKGKVTLKDVTWIPTWVYYEYHPQNGASYYQIMPLDRYEEIIKDKNIDFSSDAKASLERTNAIINEGTLKIKKALPLQ